MTITAKIHRIMPGAGKLKAIAEVVLDGEFVIHEVRVVDGANGLFASMPGYLDRNGRYRDYCFPITAGCADSISTAVVTAYRDACQALQ